MVENLSAQQQNKVLTLLEPINDPRIKDRHFEQVPAIGASADGKQLFVAWYSGGAAPGPGNYVTVAVSTDHGKSWMNDQLVIYPGDPSVRVFDPALWRDGNNQMNLFFGVSGKNKLFDGWGGVNTLPISWTGSRLVAGEVIRIADGIMSNKPIQLDKSTALFPLYIDELEDRESGAPKDGAYILSQNYSSTQPSLTRLKPYGAIEIEDELRIHDEPQIVHLQGEEFLGLVRTVKGIYYAVSKDNGRTWSKVSPFVAAGPTTSSRFYIGKLKSGNLSLVMNSSTTRNNMTAFLSKDGGRSWPHRLLLDARENVSYPDADQTSDGTIHVVFDRDRTGDKEILYSRFSEADILSGTSKNIFRNRVNGAN